LKDVQAGLPIHKRISRKNASNKKISKTLFAFFRSSSAKFVEPYNGGYWCLFEKCLLTLRYTFSHITAIQPYLNFFPLLSLFSLLPTLPDSTDSCHFPRHFAFDLIFQVLFYAALSL